ILLAAGISRRMGARNKLLLPVNGVAMVRHVAEMYLKAVDGPVIVVTGFEAARVEAVLTGTRLEFVHNEDFADGQPSSVATGLRRAPEADMLLIGLADQPLLRSDDLNTLITAHRAGDPGKITIPVWGDQRGNPIVVPHTLRPRLTENPDRPGCMRFTRDHREHVQQVALSAPGFYTDIDTPAEYDALNVARREVFP
ncbi:MAG: NTP transferase domain-containing protein, partial [Arenibacterium sp.]